MNEELDKLFGTQTATVTIQGVSYPVKKITVAIMASVNILTTKAYSVMDLQNVKTEVDVAAIAAEVISVLIDGGENQARLEVVISALTGIKPETFRELTTEDLTDLIMKIAKVNQDFFSMKLAPKMRLALESLGAGQE